MATALYTTENRAGVDVNNVFFLDTGTPEYPNPPFLPGTTAEGIDGSFWIYACAGISINPGNVVLFSAVPGSWSVSLIGGATVATAPTGQLIGIVGGSLGQLTVPGISGTQSLSYFWVQVAGNCPNVTCLASTTSSAQLHSSATTAGTVTSSGGGGATTYQVNGMVISQATGSAAGPNTAILDFPTVGATN